MKELLKDTKVYESHFLRLIEEVLKQIRVPQAVFYLNHESITNYGEELIPFSVLEQIELDIKSFGIYPHEKIELKKLNSRDLGSKGVFDIYAALHSNRGEKTLIIFLADSSNFLTEEDIFPIIELIHRYYAYIPREENQHIIDIYSDFKRVIKKDLLLNFTSKKDIGVISRFTIQNLSNYYRNMGENFGRAINTEIRNEILKHLKKGDTLYRLDQRTYLTYSHDCKPETVKHRFGEITFEIHELTIRFELEFFPVEYSSIEDDRFWQTISRHYQ